MPECIAHGVDRSTGANKIDTEGMTKRVSVNTLVDPGLLRETRQQVPHIRLLNLASAQGAEERRRHAQLQLLARGEPLVDQQSGANVEADHATLIPFAVLNGQR